MVFDQTIQQCSYTSQCIDGICDGILYQTIPDPNSTNCTTYIQCALTIPILETCTVGFYNTEYAGCWLWGNC